MRRRRLLLGSRIGDQCDDVALSVFKRVPRAVIGGTLVTSPGSPAKQFGLVDWIRFFYDYFLREVYEAQQLRSAVRVFRCHTTTTESLPPCLSWKEPHANSSNNTQQPQAETPSNATTSMSELYPGFDQSDVEVSWLRFYLRSLLARCAVPRPFSASHRSSLSLGRPPAAQRGEPGLRTSPTRRERKRRCETRMCGQLASCRLRQTMLRGNGTHVLPSCRPSSDWKGT